jgi:3-hydroxyacyl-CoA dehydrogenase
VVTESNTVKRAGVIGLGAMGLQMARHMAAKGSTPPDTT